MRVPHSLCDELPKFLRSGSMSFAFLESLQETLRPSGQGPCAEVGLTPLFLPDSRAV